MAGCGDDATDRLNAAVHTFADALNKGDAQAAAAVTSDSAQASDTLGKLFDSLGKNAHFEVSDGRSQGQRRDAAPRRHMEIRQGRPQPVDLHHYRQREPERRRVEDPMGSGDRRARPRHRPAVVQHADPRPRRPGAGPHRRGAVDPAGRHAGQRVSRRRRECRCGTAQSDRRRVSPRSRCSRS